MIPRTSSGRGFKGAAAYYLHDKGQDTANRVKFTVTENLSTDNPERAINEMCWTAMHQHEIKMAAGVKATGRKLDKPVYAFSLSWHPSEKPTDQDMRGAASAAIKALKMESHQLVMVAHNDTDHAHIHVLVNRVHPETGIAHPLKSDHLILSKWAQAYEREHGQTWCLDRVKNNDMRERAADQKAKGLERTAFIKDLKSQERDARPEYDRRAKGRRAKDADAAIRAKRAKRVQHLVGQERIGPAASKQPIRSVNDNTLTRPIVSPQVLNRLQDRHISERQALLISYEARVEKARSIIEETYGPTQRQYEQRLAEIKSRQDNASWLSGAVDRLKGVAAERDTIEHGLANIKQRSNELLDPIAREKRQDLIALKVKQDQDKFKLADPAPVPDRIKNILPPEVPPEKKRGRDFD